MTRLRLEMNVDATFIKTSKKNLARPERKTAPRLGQEKVQTSQQYRFVLSNLLESKKISGDFKWRKSARAKTATESQ